MRHRPPPSQPFLTRPPAGQKGFTLVEVLVAFSLVAIALAAGLRAMDTLSRNAQRQAHVLRAQLCAENALVQLELSRQMPSVGHTEQVCEQAGERYPMDITVHPTPNPHFRRVELRVRSSTEAQVQVSTVIGRY